MTLVVPEEIKYSTLPIYELNDKKDIIGSGTGFIFSFPLDKKGQTLVLVTNRHVLFKGPYIKVIFTIQNEDGSPAFGHTVGVNIETKDGIPHPDPKIDLAVLPLENTLKSLIAQGYPVFYRYVDTSLIPNTDDWAKFDAIAEVVSFGYPEGFGDMKNNMPIIRRGITATYLTFDFEGRREFLADIPAFRGCSGSPVYGSKKALSSDMGSPEISGDNTLSFLLGIQYEMRAKVSKVKLESTHGAITGMEAFVSTPMNLGNVIKSSELLVFKDLLE